MDELEFLDMAENLVKEISLQEEKTKHNAIIEKLRMEVHQKLSQVHFTSLAHAMKIAHTMADKVARNQSEKNVILQRLRETILANFEGRESLAFAQIQEEY